MKNYIASPINGPLKKELSNLRILESYFYIKGRKNIKKEPPKIDWFLDSGAFSAWSQKKKINIEEYADFILKNKSEFDVYANLDSIGDPLQTQTNQEYLESRGLNPLPVYHYNEPLPILHNLIAKYEYIALGGMVPISTKDLEEWLKEVFKYICNEEGHPKIKVHGFGMTTLSLIERYPWYSIDSTSPIMGAAMGRVYTNRGELNLSRNAGVLSFSITEYCRKFIPQYTLDQLRDDYKVRTILNIQYMQELEKRLTENPPVYICRQLQLL